MAILNFPDHPQTGDQYTGDNGTTYVYDGVKWLGTAGSGTSGTNSIVNNGNTVQVDSTGKLVLPAYALPNTVGTNGQVLKWPSSGTTLVWANDNNSGGGGGGSSATITLGTVTTGAAGSSASITNSGTSTDAVFNFTIPRGNTGAQGDTGATGAQGIKGDTGNTGPKGDTGNTGPKGDTGNTGAQGLKGDTGATGPKGDTGNTGAQGVSVTLRGTKATISDLPGSGSAGDAWIVTTGDGGSHLDGSLWFWNTSTSTWNDIGKIVGPQGDRGLTGAKGDTGNTGATGPKGDTGAQGIQGNTGATGPKGDTGNTGATGPKGDTGNTGPKGDTGNAGPGIATGGTAGQILAKVDSTDYNTHWIDQSSTSSLVNGSATLTLNSDGSVSVPLASVIKATTDSYTGIATHDMNTFAYVNADGFFVDTLYNTAEYEWHFNNTGGLTLPSSIFPITFSAVLLPIYGGAPDIGPYGGDAWTLSVTFTEDANGVVSTSVAQIFPISNNPGYKTGDTYHFTQTAHGIPGYTLTIVLDNVQYPGGAGWTANVECSQAPASPSTVSSNHAIKINSNNNIWAFGTDGGLTLPDGSNFGNGGWNTTNGIALVNHDTDFSLSSVVMVEASGQAILHSQNDSGTIQLSVTTDSLNNVITVVNNSHTWTFSNDGYLTGESLHLTGYLKGVDGSTGSTGQVLTRQSNGGVAWADSTGGSSNPNGGVADNTAGITITTYTLQSDLGQYDNSGSVTYNIRDAGATAAGVIINGITVSHTQTITGGINQGDNVISWSTIDYQLWEHMASVTAYVTDSRGYTFYTVVQDAYDVPHGPCLVEGTMITMANGTQKAIEDITHGELIRVWNFDLGEFTEAQPIWIKAEEETTGHDVYTFSDGTKLRTVGHHVFNKQAGAFTKLKLAETPVGTTTFNEQGIEVTLISKERVIEPTRYYNVWTQYHLNLFADGILTSNRFNNIYPIVDMKFVKDDRKLRSVEEFAGIDEKYITGLRLQEQTYSVEYIQNYVHNRLERTDISNISEQGI